MRNFQNAAGSKMYRTRRDWLLAEMILGIISLATGLAAITSGGTLAASIYYAGLGAVSWFVIFTGSGSALLVTAIVETAARSSGTSQRITLCRYAQCRMWVHFISGLCWLYAFIALLELFVERNILIASILFQSLPLLVFNIWGVCEHAKALWFDTERAGTASLVRAVTERMRSSGSATGT